MTQVFTLEETIASVPRLTRVQLLHFVSVELVRPDTRAGAPVFRPVDIARLHLLCDLSLDLDLDDAALDVVVSLLDQLHAARQDLAFVLRLIDALPEDQRARIARSAPEV